MIKVDDSKITIEKKDQDQQKEIDKEEEEKFL
jgi:hypothetical protein